MKKVYIIACISLVSVITLVVVIYNIYQEYSFDGIEKVHSIKTNYVYNVAEDNYLEIVVYSNNPKSILKEYEGVTFSITDGDTTLTGEIEEVLRITTYKYNDEKFYSYKIYAKPADVNLTFKMSSCTFSTRDFNVKIGSVSAVDISKHYTTPLDFTKLYAIGNDHLGFTSISAFVITIKNKASYSVVIDDFYIGEYNSVKLNKAVALSKDIGNSEDITEYIPDYNVFDYSQDIGYIEIPGNTSIKLLVPVYYKSKSFFGNTLIYINDQLYVDNFNYIQCYDELNDYKDIIYDANIS